jgi:hypothetical protein
MSWHEIIAKRYSVISLHNIILQKRVSTSLTLNLKKFQLEKPVTIQRCPFRYSVPYVLYNTNQCFTDGTRISLDSVAFKIISTTYVTLPGRCRTFACREHPRASRTRTCTSSWRPARSDSLKGHRNRFECTWKRIINNNLQYLTESRLRST